VVVKALGLMGIPMFLVMVPLYIAGANRFECGEAWLKSTVVYLSDSPAVEWTVAAMACVAAAGQSFVVIGLRKEVDHLPEHNLPALTTVNYLKMVLIWTVLCAIFAVPTFFFCAVSITAYRQYSWPIQDVASTFFPALHRTLIHHHGLYCAECSTVVGEIRHQFQVYRCVPLGAPAASWKTVRKRPGTHSCRDSL